MKGQIMNKLNEKQLESIQLHIKNNGVYRFEKRPGDGYAYPTSDQYFGKSNQKRDTPASTKAI